MPYLIENTWGGRGTRQFGTSVSLLSRWRALTFRFNDLRADPYLYLRTNHCAIDLMGDLRLSDLENKPVFKSLEFVNPWCESSLRVAQPKAFRLGDGLYELIDDPRTEH
jgi:hypothetical protein